MCSCQITVDTTAPLPGVVSDSEQSQADIDFQQDSTQHASWQGFFDRESGIKFYQYAFSDGCVSASEFSVPPLGKVSGIVGYYGAMICLVIKMEIMISHLGDIPKDSEF